MNRLLWVLFFAFVFVSCDNNEPDLPDANSIVTVRPALITSYYMGNGVQWGGYDILEAWTGNAAHSTDDWNKLVKRVDFMQPALVRIMVNKNWNYLVNGLFDPSKSDPVLVPILDYCEQRGITVILGEWGHTGGDTINHEWLNQAADFLEWLLVTKNYSCIKYFNMVNEPNGNWSSVNGNYTLWKQLVEDFHALLVAKGIDTRIKLAGPDIAVWNADQCEWISHTRFDLDAQISTYDMHTYPSETEVRDGSYFELIKSCRQLVPSSHELIMSEFGFKYKAGSALAVENTRRIAHDEYASDDSNMMTYDAFYGVDMADAMMQNMLAGFAGMIIWSLDDAMYNIDGSPGTRLKRWGFWNILGSEKFGNPDDENIRPWFHPVSLMCRYFPEGTKIHEIALPLKKGFRAVAGEKEGKYTLAIVNSGYVKYEVNLAFEEGIVMPSVKSYRFIADAGSAFTADFNEEGFAAPFQSDTTLDFSNKKALLLSIPAQSFWLFTNMN
ncbi:MAG: hypothetical protein R6X09_01700 [Bacteroidales bacterium]